MKKKNYIPSSLNECSLGFRIWIYFCCIILNIFIVLILITLKLLILLLMPFAALSLLLRNLHLKLNKFIRKENLKYKEETDDTKYEDSDALICLHCGHHHPCSDLVETEELNDSASCKKCGYLFVAAIRKKSNAMLELMENDPKAKKMIEADNMDAFYKYLEEKKGPF